MSFSVIIPLYNKKNQIKQTLQSVLDQTFQEFEIIVIDDGSTDGSNIEVEKINDKRIRLIKQENAGVSSARNRGIQESSYEFIAFLDADDHWSPYYLEKNHSIIKEIPDTFIIGSHYTRHLNTIETTNCNLKYFQVSDYFRKAVRNTLFFTSATIVRREFFLNNSGFNTKLKFAEDLDVWFRIMLQNPKAFYIQNTLVHYSNQSNQKWVASFTSYQERMLYNLDSLYYKNSEIDITPEFQVFLSKFIYSGLYNFYHTGIDEIDREVTNLIDKINPKYFLAHIFYKFPIFTKYKKISRIYFKFIFRFIHI